jgi:hypothetical protein
MNTVPDEKQGVASAVNDTTREVGAAVGIAVAGSVLAAHYNTVLAPGLEGFPDQVREPALDSLAQALAVAGQMGPQGTRLADLAESAFIQSMDLSLLVVSIVSAVAAAFVALWSPGRDGEQFRFVQRLTSRSRSDDELGGPVTDHHDGGVWSTTRYRRQHRPVHHPQPVDAADPALRIQHGGRVALWSHRRGAAQML